MTTSGPATVPRRRPFAQVDVFGAEPYRGNALAVVLDGDGLDDEAMQRYASWTNLSETTFVFPAEDPAADYRLRIFTPARELPFAGHPTLGSAHAWLESGGSPGGDDIVQECGVGLVRVKRDGDRLAFAAPPITRDDEDPGTLARVVTALRIHPDQVVAARWVDNGAGWFGVLLADAEAVRALRPDFAALDGLNVGVVGFEQAGAPTHVEVRGFPVAYGIAEDPVTGSLNASLAQWLIGEGRLPQAYVAAQGGAVGRAGRVYVTSEGGDTWIGGRSVTCIDGAVLL